MEQQSAAQPRAQTSAPISAERSDRADGLVSGMLALPAGQLCWLSEGAQRVQTSAGAFVTSPQYAVWIPRRTAHDTAKWGSGSSYWIRFSGSLNQDLPQRCCTVRMTPRLREAVLQAERLRTLDALHPLRAVFLEEIRDAGLRPLELSPEQPQRLQPLMATLLRQPSDSRSLDQWAAELRMSPRTLTRTFQREVGMTYRDWRRQAQLMHALERLAQGQPVSSVAQQVGFKSVSMFIQMFRCSLGTTPGRYYS
ncbi:MAG TPA: AraC family transcriptional regulator [Polyangiales bacterium]|nr:AraC family transcriptional regulator [Polyangiales bacterium]